MEQLPILIRTMATMGEQLRLARLRRQLGTVQVAQRAGISRQTLYRIERGDPAVGLGLYAQVLLVLGLEKDLLKVAEDDVLGRKLQDIGLVTRKRAPRRRTE
jgi:transcriptional regulator with XRE-family HTH domain